MKILFLGEIGPGQTSLMRMRALQRLGHEVEGVNTVAPWQEASWTARQIQRRAGRGSIVNAINASVAAAAQAFRPDLVWAEKQEFLATETIEEMRRSGARLVHYTPDPYFSLAWKRTRLMDEAIRCFDVLVYCKAYERSSYEALDRPLVYMSLGYCDEIHRPMANLDSDWLCDVGFLGGWEPRRERLLNAVTETGITLGLRGYGWEPVLDGRWTPRRHIIMRQLAGSEAFTIRRNAALASCYRGGEVYGDDYARALSGAAIGLGFLRTICDDQHTTRSFEIPACGSMLLADRTEEHQEFFTEGTEAEFFGSREELIDKVRFFTDNPDARQRIAAAGRRRCIESGYAYRERLAACLAAIETQTGKPV